MGRINKVVSTVEIFRDDCCNKTIKQETPVDKDPKETDDEGNGVDLPVDDVEVGGNEDENSL